MSGQETRPRNNTVSGNGLEILDKHYTISSVFGDKKLKYNYPRWVMPIAGEKVVVWLPAIPLNVLPRDGYGNIDKKELRSNLKTYTPIHEELPARPKVGTVLARQLYKGTNSFEVFSERNKWEIYSRSDTITGLTLADGECSVWESEQLMKETFNALGD